MAKISIDICDLSESMDQLESETLQVGRDKGLELVVKWLESKTRLHDFLKENDEWCSEHPVHEFTNWGKLAKLLDRDSERFPKSKE